MTLNCCYSLSRMTSGTGGSFHVDGHCCGKNDWNMTARCCRRNDWKMSYRRNDCRHSRKMGSGASNASSFSLPSSFLWLPSSRPFLVSFVACALLSLAPCAPCLPRLLVRHAFPLEGYDQTQHLPRVHVHQCGTHNEYARSALHCEHSDHHQHSSAPYLPLRPLPHPSVSTSIDIAPFPLEDDLVCPLPVRCSLPFPRAARAADSPAVVSLHGASGLHYPSFARTVRRDCTSQQTYSRCDPSRIGVAQHGVAHDWLERAPMWPFHGPTTVQCHCT